MKRDSDAEMADFAGNARKLYANFMALCAKR